MIRGRLMQTVRQFRRETDPARRLLLAEKLRDALPRARLLPSQRHEVVAVLGAVNLAVPENVPEAPLRLGETWLPLYGQLQPDVARLRIRAAGPAGTLDAPVGRDGADQLRIVRDVVIARLARQGARPRNAADRGYKVELDLQATAPAPVDGPSLGVAAAVAMISLELQQLPRPDTAASAGIAGDGTLTGVGHLPEKIAALREHMPDVRRLVVAQAQRDVPHLPPGVLEVVRSRTVDDAFREFGLSLDESCCSLPKLGSAQIKVRLTGFEHAVEPGYTKEAWLGHAMEAWTTACLSDRDPDRIRALGFAALFSLHAGDERAALRYLAGVDEASVGHLSPSARVWIRIIRATAAIDRAPDDAVPLAEAAAGEAEGLLGEDRALLLGRAYGTLGRALVHAARADDVAVSWLRKAADHHAQYEQEQYPRSLTYLAMGLRLAGQPKEALDVALRALDLCGRHGDAGEVANSRMFLRLETGRCRRELGDLPTAAGDLEECCVSQTADDDYPRLGGLRTLVGVYADLGEWDRADERLTQCLRVSAASPDGGLIGQIAACAAGEALLRSSPWRWSAASEVVEREWRRHFARGCGHAELREGLQVCVY